MENQSSISNISTCNSSREMGRKSVSPFMDHMMSTPVTKRLKMNDERVNPFERHLLSRLHEPFWSPSVLNCTSDTSVETPSASGWEIDHIAKLNPIGIEESPSTHQNETVLDPQSEAQAQEAISRFFSTSEPIAPSPIAIAQKSDNAQEAKNTIATNTDLSFPFNMPPDFERFLSSFSNSNGGSINTSSFTTVSSRNIFNCVDIEIEGSSNSNGSSNQSGGSVQHPPTPNAELNTSQTRRRLDFTFEMDYNEEETRDFDGVRRQLHLSSTDEESDGDHYPITSAVLDFENSHGITMHSPEDSSRVAGTSTDNTLGDGDAMRSGFRLRASSGYVSIGRSLEGNSSLLPSISSPMQMETSFADTAAGAGSSRFIRGSCDEDYLSISGEEKETAASARLKMMLQSPGATPIRM